MRRKAFNSNSARRTGAGSVATAALALIALTVVAGVLALHREQFMDLEAPALLPPRRTTRRFPFTLNKTAVKPTPAYAFCRVALATPCS